MAEKQPYILWLPSWYPSKKEPYSGDFIQRHAQAASLYNKIIVIFFTQYGEKVHTTFNIEIKEAKNLKEFIVYVPFKPIGIGILDKIAYNIMFYSFSRKYLKRFFKEYDLPKIVHVHVPVKAGNLALFIKRRFSIPYIVSEQASTYLKEAPDNYFRRNWWYKKQVRKIFSKADFVTNVSATVGNILTDLFPIKQYFTIHNVVDSSLFFHAPKENKLFTYIHVSSLSEQKNILGLLRAFKKLYGIRKDWHLLLVGPLNSTVTDFVANNHLQQVITLTGEVSYGEVARYMRYSDVFVLFSKHENFPCVVVEALCCGLPVISSDIAGIKEAVNYLNGILIESENENELLQALFKVRELYFSYNPVSISKDAVRRFSYPVIGLQFADLYKRTSC